MKSLEDLKVTKSVSYIQTGTDGINRQVTNNHTGKLRVKTINQGLRFVHLIVDYFILGIISYLLGAIPGVNENQHSLLEMVAFLSYPAFYTFMEYKYQQTPGKMVTNYVVIDNYANKPNFKTCLLRTLIRFVPFEPFSCLESPSRGWHDKWTKTYVVHKDEAVKLKALLEKENEGQLMA